MVKNDDQGAQHDLYAYIFFYKHFQHTCNMSMKILNEITDTFQLILLAMQHLFGIESCPVLRRITLYIGSLSQDGHYCKQILCLS